jgi:hypothetical protein
MGPFAAHHRSRQGLDHQEAEVGVLQSAGVERGVATGEEVGEGVAGKGTGEEMRPGAFPRVVDEAADVVFGVVLEEVAVDVLLLGDEGLGAKRLEVFGEEDDEDLVPDLGDRGGGKWSP